MNDLPHDSKVSAYIVEIENIPYAFTLPENSADATLVGTIANSGLTDPVFTIAAGNEDPDQDGSPAFAIDSATGAIAVSGSGDLDFESLPQFSLTVVAEDASGKSLTNTAQISLTNADEPGNEQPEVQDSSFAIAERPLKATPLGTIGASDIDPGDTSQLVYSIVSGNADVNGNGQAAFAVDAATGQVAVNDPDDLDYETHPIFTLGVAATDTGGLSGHGTVKVQLADISEFQGTAGPDTLRGAAGNDRLDGLDGNDTLQGKAGDDLLMGGAGTDTVREQGDVDFMLTDAQLTGLGTDILSSIERANLVGGNGANVLDASAFTQGPVILNGASGDNTLDASGFTNGPVTLEGREGSNTLIGGAGANSVREHGDLDFVLTESLLTGQAGASAPVIRDALSSIEQACLSGGTGDNVLDASGFNGQLAVLEGGAGDDTLIGGGAIDQASGGQRRFRVDRHPANRAWNRHPDRHRPGHLGRRRGREHPGRLGLPRAGQFVGRGGRRHADGRGGR